MFRVPAHCVGVFQGDGGYLRVEPALRAQIAIAQAAGAAIKTNTTVHAIESMTGGVRVVTDAGYFEAGQAIVTAGAWVKKLLPTLRATIRTTRQVVGWFAPVDKAPLADAPVFLLENSAGVFYGFPLDANATIKFAKHHHLDEPVDPDAPGRAMDADDQAILRAALSRYLPAANGPLVKSETCLYTMSADGDFILDRVPERPPIIVASPCSGHGFKFAPVIGEILADLALGGTTRHDISRFRLSRFGGSSRRQG
jgi:sarcosine oxidase